MAAVAALRRAVALRQRLSLLTQLRTAAGGLAVLGHLFGGLSAGQFLRYELARLIPRRLGLPLGAAPFVAAPEGWWWFHWLGDHYGRAALDLLRYRIPAHETEQIGLCLRLPDEPQTPPAW